MIDIKPSQRNTNRHRKEGMDLLENSINKVGVIESISVASDGTIISGHARFEHFEKQGKKPIEIHLKENEYPVIVTDIENNSKEYFEAQILANTTANKNFDLDIEMIEVIAEEFDIDIEEVGVEVVEVEDDTILEAEEDDFDATPPTIAKTVLGDLYEIGEHRLLCGDSTCSDAVAKLMNGQKADMVFTDPPYKIQTEGGCKGITGEALKKQGKDIEFISDFNPTDFLNTMPLVFENKRMNAYVFCNKDLLPDYLLWAREIGYSFNVLIWKKPNAIPIGDSHRPDIEYLLLFRKSAIWNNSLKDVNYSRCLEFGRESGLHPTMKPIELISNEMKISSNQNSLIVDFFLGSGSTMVASHQLKRKCYGMELDPKYCDVIVKRMIKLDDTLTVKRNGVDCTNEFKD